MFTSNVKAEASSLTEFVPTNRWGIVLTQNEIVDLAKIVQLEYGNGSYEAKVAVAETIFNRMVDPRFPDTLEGVISQSGQFGTYRRKDKADVSEDTYMVVIDVLFGKTDVLPNDYVYFNNRPIGKEIIQFGGHYHGK